MKPLTVEELKALEVGDWVWEDKSKVYEFIKDKTNEFLLTLCDGVLDRHYYSDYGTKWIAYKNKEQAETKGKIVELPTIIFFPDMHPILGKIITYQVVWLSELLGIRTEKYAAKEQAEARLKELQEGKGWGGGR